MARKNEKVVKLITFIQYEPRIDSYNFGPFLNIWQFPCSKGLRRLKLINIFSVEAVQCTLHEEHANSNKISKTKQTMFSGAVHGEGVSGGDGGRTENSSMKYGEGMRRGMERKGRGLLYFR